MRVLVVDDDPDILESTGMVLEGRGHEVHTHGSVRGLLDRIRALHPDVVLQDVHMYGLDVPAHMHAMQQDPELSQVPVVLFTASVHVSEVQGIPGVVGVVAKPFTLQDLEAALAKAVTRRKTMA